jgi:hypothetical protein
MRSTLRIRITVRGRLSQRLAPAFDGLTLRPRAGATELFGEIADQTQLHALLTRIRDLGLDLRSVTVLDADPTKPDRDRSVVGRASRHENPDARHKKPLVSNERNKLEGGLR